MTPTIALVALLTIVSMRPFFELPETTARTEAMTRGGYKPSASRSCLYTLLLPAMLGLWWYYALATDQVLLGVIPTVGLVGTVLAVAGESVARKAAATTKASR